MVLPGTFLSAVILLVLSMICFGLWPNIFKFARANWRFELFSMDFGLGAVLLALLAAYTFGTQGSELGFSDNMLVAGRRTQAVSVLAGCAFALGNMCFLATIALLGLSNACLLAFCVFGCGLAALHLEKGHYATSGIALLILVVGALVAIISAKTKLLQTAARTAPVATGTVKPNTIRSNRPPQRAAAKAFTRSTKGVITGALAGIAFVGVLPLLAMAEPPQLGIGAYGGVLLSSLGLFLASIFFNFFFLNIALEGGKIGYGTYVAGSWKDHMAGVAGGAVWTLGALTLYAACTGTPGLDRAAAWLGPFGGGLIAIFTGLFFWQKASQSPEAKRMTLIATALFACGVAVLLAGLR